MSVERKKAQALPVLKNYAHATAQYPWLFLGVIIAILAATATNLAAPLFLKEFIDLISKGDTAHASLVAMLTVLGIYALITFSNWASYRIQMLAVTRLEAHIQSDLTNKAFGYLIGHGHDFFINNFAGTLTRRVNRYARSYQQVFNSVIESMLPTLLFAAGVIIVLYVQNHWLGIGLLVWTVLFLILQFAMTKWRYQYKILRTAQDSRLTGALSDVVGNHSTVTFFASEDKEKSRLADVVKDWHAATVRAWNSDIFNYAVQGFLTRLAQVGLLLAGFYLWWHGLISVGGLVLIQVYILSLMDQVSSIGSNMRQLYDAFSEASEMIDIIEEPHLIQNREGAGELVVTKGEVELTNVSFAFENKESILKDFNLKVIPGEKIALVGPSGAGKSTITKLMLRLYDVSEGSIRVDGIDIRDVSQQSLRSAISFVPQESTLFHRTLRENISYGKFDATDEEIVAAAKKAHCHEFISKLPLGYETFVGERGIKLSGGERQRVAIARAILKNAPLLILDEATSALDSESEALIQDALRALMEGKTVMVIAHRLSTIMKMDRIVVIENGAIAADGTHDDLLKEGGLYHKLWSIQAGSFIPDSGK